MLTFQDQQTHSSMHLRLAERQISVQCEHGEEDIL